MRLEGVHGDMSFNHRCPAIFAGLASASTLVVPTDAQVLTVGGVIVLLILGVSLLGEGLQQKEWGR